MDKKPPFRLTPICRVVLMLTFLTEAQAALAGANFRIVPAGALPTTVPVGGSVTANYTVTNTTQTTRSGYHVEGFPSTVTQDSTSPNCSNPIQLLPAQSCNLALTITGPVNSKFALCNAGSCTTSPEPLVVTSEAVSLTLMIASGIYHDTVPAYLPLLARYDGTLTYPPTILSNFPSDPAYDQPNLIAASCSGLYCAAVGGDVKNFTKPLMAFSSDGAITWTYPIGSTGTWPDDIFEESGLFFTASCLGDFCIAAGTYVDDVSGFLHPLLARYQNNIRTYPITSAEQPFGFYFYGAFNASSCSTALCIAAGSYDTFDNDGFPLLAQSVDQGENWVYAIDSTTFLPNNFGHKGGFNSASCFEDMCIAGGSYEDDDDAAAVHFPLLAQSTDGGANWSYVIDSGTGPQLPSRPPQYTDNQFNGTSCSATICIAAGTYLDNDTSIQSPMLAQSTDGGSTWAYVITNTLNPPADLAGEGRFTSASCDGSFCIAAGFYTNNSSNQIGMVAQTTNGGATWTYVIDSSNGPILPDYTADAYFTSASCAGNVCMAVGAYTADPYTYPMYAQSSNGGGSWTYIVSAVPATLPPNYNDDAVFEGSAATAASAFKPDGEGHFYEWFKEVLKKNDGHAKP